MGNPQRVGPPGFPHSGPKSPFHICAARQRIGATTSGTADSARNLRIDDDGAPRHSGVWRPPFRHCGLDPQSWHQPVIAHLCCPWRGVAWGGAA